MTMIKQLKARVVIAVMLALFAVAAGSQVMPGIVDIDTAYAGDCDDSSCGG